MKANPNGKCTFEVSLQARSPSREVGEFLKEVLLSLNIPPTQMVEQVKGDVCRLSVYFPVREDASLLAQQVRGLNLKNVSIIFKILKQADWQNRWKKNIRPFQLTRHFDVVPGWCRRVYRKNKRTPLYIDTTMAFGTGLHETTRFMAQLIDEWRDRFNSFLDVGTGTGLLALVAYHCGADEVYVVDIDKESIRVAKKNLSANGYRFDKALVSDFGADPQLNKRFDFVAANLMTHDLIRLRHKLVAITNPGKFLAVSGISLSNLNKLQQEFRGLPLRCLRIIKGKQWAALLYQRTS